MQNCRSGDPRHTEQYKAIGQAYICVPNVKALNYQQKQKSKFVKPRYMYLQTEIQSINGSHRQVSGFSCRCGSASGQSNMRLEIVAIRGTYLLMSLYLLMSPPYTVAENLHVHIMVPLTIVNTYNLLRPAIFCCCFKGQILNRSFHHFFLKKKNTERLN